MRRGVILLITVGFITAIMAVIAYQFAIVDKGLKRSSEEGFYYQCALLLNDVQTKLLPSVMQEVVASCSGGKKADCLEGFLSMSYNLPTPLINDPVIGTVVITLEPPVSGFDINRFKNLSPGQREFFRIFAQKLDDVTLLEELIDLTLETNTSNTSYEYLITDDDLPVNSIFFRHGEIVDREQFDVILKSYYAKTKDDKVYSLDWDAFLDYRTSGHPTFATLKEPYCRALFFEKDSQWLDTYCKNEEEIFFSQDDVTGITQDDLNATLNPHGITFAPDTTAVLVKTDITQGDNSASFRFMYDLNANHASWTEADM